MDFFWHGEYYPKISISKEQIVSFGSLLNISFLTATTTSITENSVAELLSYSANSARGFWKMQRVVLQSVQTKVGSKILGSYKLKKNKKKNVSI